MAVQIPELYVIAVVENDEIVHYYNHGKEDIEWSVNIEYADFFVDTTKLRLAYETIVNASGYKNKPSSDGTIFPHHYIHRALRLSTHRPKITAELVVLRLNGEVKQATKISGEIKKPTGYTYDES